MRTELALLRNLLATAGSGRSTASEAFRCAVQYVLTPQTAIPISIPNMTRVDLQNTKLSIFNVLAFTNSSNEWATDLTQYSKDADDHMLSCLLYSLFGLSQNTVFGPFGHAARKWEYLVSRLNYLSRYNFLCTTSKCEAWHLAVTPASL